MIPYKDHNGHTAYMSREEFFSCGYVPIHQSVKAFAGRMLNKELADLYRVSESRIEDLRQRYHVKQITYFMRWTPEHDRLLRSCCTSSEAARVTGKTVDACKSRAKAIGHSFRGKYWQPWEDDLFDLGKSVKEVAAATGRSVKAVRLHLKYLRRQGRA
jgi:hypothetical protein